MFFPERVVNISAGDLVLEVGPGGGPHPRSDVFLDMHFDDCGEESLQRSNTPALKTDKPFHYYDGTRFPFADNEFDYVICAHVLEHVVNVEEFVSELQRVAKKGYLEFPTIYYDYIYNMPTHINFVINKKETIYYMPKKETNLVEFSPVQEFFYKTLDLRYTAVIKDYKNYFFQGFEWQNKIEVVRARSVAEVSYDLDQMTIPKKVKNRRGFFRLVRNMFGRPVER
jgi:hypothetical protein